VTAQDPPRHGWRFVAALVLIAVAAAFMLQEAAAAALARWLAGVWVSTIDILLRILGAPLNLIIG